MDGYKQHLKFLKLPYLNLCLKLRPASKLDKKLRPTSNVRSNVRKNVRQFHQLFQLLYYKLSQSLHR